MHFSLVQFSAMPCSAFQCNIVQFSAAQYGATQRSAGVVRLSAFHESVLPCLILSSSPAQLDQLMEY